MEGQTKVPEYPDQTAGDFDDGVYNAADDAFRDELRRFIRAGARHDNIEAAIDAVLEEL